MAKKAGSFGTVILIVVMAIVLILVAKSWEQLAPTVLGLDGDTELTTEDGTVVGGLPGLNEAQAGADAHTAEVGDALSAIE